MWFDTECAPHTYCHSLTFFGVSVVINIILINNILLHLLNYCYI